MLYTLKGLIIKKENGYFVVESGNIGFKVFSDENTLKKLALRRFFKIFCFVYLREERLELYGFLEEESLKLFEMLNSVVGIGPKMALSVLGAAAPSLLMAAIVEKKMDFLMKAGGVGRKTAERIIVELQNKIKLPQAKKIAGNLDMDGEIEEILVGLGYQLRRARAVLKNLPAQSKNLEERLRASLKEISRFR